MTTTLKKTALKDASHLYEVERRAYHLQRPGFRISELQLSPTQTVRSEEHTSELQSHRDLHSFPTRRSSDLPERRQSSLRGRAPSLPLAASRLSHQRATVVTDANR